MPAKAITWTDQQRRQIEALAGYGLTTAQISCALDISEAALNRHAKREMARGRSVAIGNVTKSLYAMAVSGKVPAATFFYLKCLAHWKEVHHQEVSLELPVSPILGHREKK